MTFRVYEEVTKAVNIEHTCHFYWDHPGLTGQSD